VPGYPKFWTDKRSSLKADYQLLVAKHPNAEVQLKHLFKILCNIEDVAGYTPASVGESVQWTSTVNTVDDNRSTAKLKLERSSLVPCIGTYTVTLNESKTVLKASTLEGQTTSPKAAGEQITQDKGFKEVRRHKRCNTEDETQNFRETSNAGQNVCRLKTPHSKFLHPPQSNRNGHRHLQYRGHTT
jgi:hypothetical protein